MSHNRDGAMSGQPRIFTGLQGGLTAMGAYPARIAPMIARG